MCFWFPCMFAWVRLSLPLGLSWPAPPWLLVLHGIAFAGVFVMDQAGRPAFAVLAVLVPPGPRSLPGPGLAWQRLGC